MDKITPELLDELYNDPWLHGSLMWELARRCYDLGQKVEALEQTNTDMLDQRLKMFEREFASDIGYTAAKQLEKYLEVHPEQIVNVTLSITIPKEFNSGTVTAQQVEYTQNNLFGWKLDEHT